MPLIRIQKEHGIKHVFIAAEGIADLATVELVPGERQIKMGTTGDEHLAAGVSRGSALSGKLVRVITQGIVSGVKTAQAVNAGDRLTIATSGMVTPFNTFSVSGLVSGLTASGWLTSGDWTASGLRISGWVTASQNTGRLIGKALTSGFSGLGIQMLVCLE
jgi:hypothetical protein